MLDDRLQLVRLNLSDEISSVELAKANWYAEARAKLFNQITIDGVLYPSRIDARKKLGMTFYEFEKKYPNNC